MSQASKILMPTDFSPNANQAFRYAAMLTDKLNCELTLFHVATLYVDDPHQGQHHFPDFKEFYSKLEKNAQTKLLKFTLEYDKLNINNQLCQESGNGSNHDGNIWIERFGKITHRFND